MSSPQVSYLSLIYDIVLVRDRLRWIIADLDSTIGIPEITRDQLIRVNDFLGRKLEERNIYDGTAPEDFPRHEALARPEASMEPGSDRDFPRSGDRESS